MKQRKEGQGKQDGAFVIYSRKSKFTGKGESVENQVEMCRNYIENVYGKEAAEAALVYEDEGFSGGTLERPQFQKMMRDSHGQKFAAIVVYRLDRISRNIGDFAKLIEDLGSRGIDFISIREQFDTASPMGRAMMYIASVFSQLERETIAERIRDNMHELAKTGRWLGGTTPTGYDSESVETVSVDGKTRRACRLRAIPEEIALVRKIYEAFMETGSLTKVDQYLLERQIKTKRGKNFTRFSIRAILTNPVYMTADEDAYGYMTEHHAELFSDRRAFDGVHGIMAYNRTLQRAGKAHRLNPISAWIVAVGQHTGIISGAMWIAVQERLEQNQSKSYRAPRGHTALLSGLLRCGACGAYMRPKATDRKNAQGETIYTYICTMKERSCGKRCSMQNVSGNLLDAAVSEAVKKMLHPSAAAARAILKLRDGLEDEPVGCALELERLRTRAEETKREIEGLLEALPKSAGTAAETYILERIDHLDYARREEAERIEALEGSLQAQELTQEAYEAALEKLSQIAACFDDYSVEEKRAILRATIQKVVWDGETAQVTLA